jgi:sulfur-carrier protein
MNVNIKLFATLRTGRFVTKNLKIPNNSSIQTLCNEIGIPDDEKIIILINGRHAEKDYIISEGDTLAIFPIIGGG